VEESGKLPFDEINEFFTGHLCADTSDVVLKNSWYDDDSI
jgi:hypothetical protein